MKLIIEIPIDLLERTKSGDYNFGDDLARNEIIAHGIPYNPSGDLISRSALKTELEEYRHDETRYVSDEEQAQNILLDNVLEDIDKAEAIDLWQIRQEATENALKKAEELYARPKGEWIPMSPDCRGYSESFKCSICGAYIYPRCLEKELDYNFCPYCGADMGGDKENG